ncbi:hypothetical protein Thiowin_00652 [Thiorhodovibrio winogradskyi]|uniref:Uncharacterized protein n=1 Tax=Thiorhodovibrio winogradskyi TaxID=77007 RepID=A0ABZ0S5C1_9GAMM
MAFHQATSNRLQDIVNEAAARLVNSVKPPLPKRLHWPD